MFIMYCNSGSLTQTVFWAGNEAGIYSTLLQKVFLAFIAKAKASV